MSAKYLRISEQLLETCDRMRELTQKMLPISPVTGTLLETLRELAEVIPRYVRTLDVDYATIVPTPAASIILQAYSSTRSPRYDGIELLYTLEVRCGACMGSQTIELQGMVGENQLQAMIPKMSRRGGSRIALSADKSVEHPMFDPADKMAKRAALFRAMGPNPSRDAFDTLGHNYNLSRGTEEALAIYCFNIIAAGVQDTSCKYCKRPIQLGAALLTQAGYVGDSIGPWYGKAHMLEHALLSIAYTLTSQLSDADKVKHMQSVLEHQLGAVNLRDDVTDAYSLAIARGRNMSAGQKQFYDARSNAYSLLVSYRNVFDKLGRKK